MHRWSVSLFSTKKKRDPTKKRQRREKIHDSASIYFCTAVCPGTDKEKGRTLGELYLVADQWQSGWSGACSAICLCVC